MARFDGVGATPLYYWDCALPSNTWWNGTTWGTFAALVAANFAGGGETTPEGTPGALSGSQLAPMLNASPPSGTITVRAFGSSLATPSLVGGVYQIEQAWADDWIALPTNAEIINITSETTIISSN